MSIDFMVFRSNKLIQKMQFIYSSESDLKFKVFRGEVTVTRGGWGPHGFSSSGKLSTDQGQIFIYIYFFSFPVGTELFPVHTTLSRAPHTILSSLRTFLLHRTLALLLQNREIVGNIGEIA